MASTEAKISEGSICGTSNVALHYLFSMVHKNWWPLGGAEYFLDSRKYYRLAFLLMELCSVAVSLYMVVNLWYDEV